MRFKLPFYNLRRGIHNIIRYVPVIWSDEDFDYEPLYNLLYHKLKFMEEFYRSDYSWSADALKTADQIKIAKNLTKRLNEDKYLENALVEHNQKYPNHLRLAFNAERVEGKPLFRLIDKNPEDEKKSFKRCSEHADYLEKQDREYLFDYLKKWVRYWWD